MIQITEYALTLASKDRILASATKLEIASSADRPRSDLIYDRIKRAIIDCKLLPGQQVTEDQLAAQYGVSRGSIRPALKRLYQEQFIQLATRNRYFVVPITLKDAQDLFDMRLLVEPRAARLAADRIDDATLQHLETLSQVQYTTGDSDSAGAFLRANREFHVLIARSSGNLLMAEIVATLLDREERLNHLAHMLGDRNQDAHHEHLALVVALRAGDGNQAATLMAEGIASARSFVIDAMLRSPALQSVNIAPERVTGA